MRPLTAGIVGCGPRSFGHAAAIRQGAALTIKYACDILSDRAAKAAGEWDAVATADYHSILTDPEVEAVLVVTDVANHLRIARDALTAGKHVIVEKPLGHDVAEARALVDLGRRSDRVVYVSFQLRFQAKLRAIHRVMPGISPVQILFGRSRGMMKEQFLNPTTFCGIMDCCAHDFDMVSWLMARAPVAVTAVVRRNTFTENTGATDTISALIDYGDGRAATVVSSIGAAEIGSKFDIAGERGNVSVRHSGELSGVRFAPCDSAGDKAEIDFDVRGGGNPDAALQRAFYQEVRDGTRSDAARLDDGLNSLLLTCACLKSMDEARRVELAELR